MKQWRLGLGVFPIILQNTSVNPTRSKERPVASSKRTVEMRFAAEV